MTTGPEHYTNAAALVSRGVAWTDDINATPDELTTDQRIALRQAENAAAQVKATLALAAALALSQPSSKSPQGYDTPDRAEWRRVAGASR